MPDFSINWLAWLVLVVGSMMLGFLWYSKALFGRPWQAAIGKTDEDMKQGVAPAMTVMVLMTFLALFFLANAIGWTGKTTFADGALIGLWLWLGLCFAPSVMNAMFTRRNMTAVWIEQLYFAVQFIVGAGIFAVWS